MGRKKLRSLAVDEGGREKAGLQDKAWEQA